MHLIIRSSSILCEVTISALCACRVEATRHQVTRESVTTRQLRLSSAHSSCESPCKARARRRHCRTRHTPSCSQQTHLVTVSRWYKTCGLVRRCIIYRINTRPVSTLPSLMMMNSRIGLLACFALAISKMHWFAATIIRHRIHYHDAHENQ